MTRVTQVFALMAATGLTRREATEAMAKLEERGLTIYKKKVRQPAPQLELPL